MSLWSLWAVALACLLAGCHGETESLATGEPASESASATTTTRPHVACVFGKQGSAPGDLAQPRGLGYDAVHGRLSVVDKSGKIKFFSRHGEFLGDWDLERFDSGYPTDMDFDEAGRMWLADTHNFRVQVFSPEGQVLLSFGQEGEAPGSFGFITGIAVSDSLVATADFRTDAFARIQIFDRQGRFVRSFSQWGEGPGDITRPNGIAWTPEGDVLVVDTLQHQVHRFSVEGQYLGSIGSEGREPGQLYYPMGLAVLADGRLAVLELGSHRIQLLSAEGRPLRQFGGWGDDDLPGTFKFPWGCCADDSGRVFIADYRNHRIQGLDAFLAP